MDDRRKRRALMVGVVVLAALIAVAVLQGRSWRDAERSEDRRTAAVALAEAQVVDLMSLSGEDVDQRLEDMSERSTGEFKRQLDGITQLFASTVTEQKISAKGSVTSSGVTRMDDETAQVLIAADTTVTTGEPRGEATGEATETPRSYRLRITMVAADGDWLIDNMEFVQ